VIGYIEPRPGIPPTPSHTVELVNLMKRENVKIELIEPYFDLKTPDSIASMVGGKVVVMMPSVGGKPEITDYFKLFDYDINVLIQAFQQVK
jgi:ABC-type Zn uptake system ZnuABC Zn-binding protein ZnuA